MEQPENTSIVKTAPAAILTLAYFPPIPYFQIMFRYEKIVFDIHEHFHKQFYFNRCLVSGPNGVMKLSIPVLHKKKRAAVKDVRISYDHNWKTLHWRSLESAYRRSPYFEFYEHHFAGVFSDFKPVFLFEWNIKIFEIINTIFGNKISSSFTTEYQESYNDADDFRGWASPAVLASQPLTTPRYQQVFEERHGFIPNISIIDLLFCKGPYSIEHLK